MTAKVTVVLPYYRQARMLEKQFATWYSYSPEAHQALELIVVDDGSPEGETALEVWRAWAYQNWGAESFVPRILRIEKDVPWNRGMARNLGTQEAKTDWVLHIDTDHVIPLETALQLVELKYKPSMEKHWFRFKRFRVGAADDTRKKDALHPTCKFGPVKPHIDSYLCTKKAYWKAGGYNEDFSGVLGGGSPFLAEMVKANGEPVVLECPLHVHTRDSVPDSSVSRLSRDPAALARRKREIMADRGTLRGHDPIRLPWHRVF